MAWRSFAAAAALASGASAWGPVGHRTVGFLAEELMRGQLQRGDAADACVAAIGGGSLEQWGNWADDYRYTKAGKWCAPLHFTDGALGNITFEGTQYENVVVAPYETACKTNNEHGDPNGCSMGAVINYTAQAMSGFRGEAGATGDALALALRMLVHIVGDMHQPLHVGLRSNLGGNTIKVNATFDFANASAHAPYPTNNLHSMWDDVMINATLAKHDWDWRHFALDIAGLSHTHSQARNGWDPTGTGAYYLPGEGNCTGYRNAFGDKKCFVGLLQGVVDESGVAAGTKAYNYTSGTEHEHVTDNSVLDQAYYNQAMLSDADNLPLNIPQRLADAGVRLAWLLVRVFDAGKKQATTDGYASGATPHLEMVV